MKPLRILITLLLITCTSIIQAQDDYVVPPVEKIRKPYRWNDNLFWGWNIYGTYSLSGFVQEKSIPSMIRPAGDFHFGKYFSQLLAVRANIGYHMQAASIGQTALEEIWQHSEDDELYDKGPAYNIHMANISADVLVNMNRLIGSSNQEPKFRVSLYAGGGFNTVFGYDPKTSIWADYIDFDSSMKFAPEVHAGVQVHFRGQEGKEFTIKGSWHTTTAGYTGLNTRTDFRNYIEVGFGITTRLLNRYASRKFEYCRGNEKYYFQLSEQHMIKEFEKQEKKDHSHRIYPQLSANVLSFPHTYPYLTPRQLSKLQEALEYLKNHPAEQLQVDIYPNSLKSDDMTFMQSSDRCKGEIWDQACLIWGDETAPIIFQMHYDETAPTRPDGIWFHNALISVIPKDNTTPTVDTETKK